MKLLHRFFRSYSIYCIKFYIFLIQICQLSTPKLLLLSVLRNFAQGAHCKRVQVGSGSEGFHRKEGPCPYDPCQQDCGGPLDPTGRLNKGLGFAWFPPLEGASRCSLKV